MKASPLRAKMTNTAFRAARTRSALRRVVDVTEMLSETRVESIRSNRFD
jgi:hypothetical protein